MALVFLALGVCMFGNMNVVLLVFMMNENWGPFWLLLSKKKHMMTVSSSVTGAFGKWRFQLPRNNCSTCILFS